ncbi:TadE/TadG family type IV pilus assembly protein [Rhodovibrionaceae bacterium A322]
MTGRSPRTDEKAAPAQGLFGRLLGGRACKATKAGRFARQDGGSVAIEFALVSFVIVLVFSLIGEVARFLYVDSLLKEAAYLVARDNQVTLTDRTAEALNARMEELVTSLDNGFLDVEKLEFSYQVFSDPAALIAGSATADPTPGGDKDAFVRMSMVYHLSYYMPLVSDFMSGNEWWPSAEVTLQNER